MDSDTAFWLAIIFSVLISIIMFSGSPDLQDAIIHNLMNEEKIHGQ